MGDLDLVLGLGGALRAVGVAAAGATTVKLDAGAGASDAIALACAARRGAGYGRWGAGAGRAGRERWDVGLVVGVILAGLILRGLVDGLGGKASGELLDGWASKVTVTECGRGVRLLGLRGLDLGWAESAALWHIGDAAGLADGFVGGDSGRLGSSRDVEDVELAASGGLDDGLAGRVVGDVVAVDDVVVPVALALLQGLSLEAKGALPATGLVSILGERKLAVVVVPRTKEVDGLAVSRSAEGEVELDSRHYVDLIGIIGFVG